MDQLDPDFDALWAQYRQAAGDPDASTNFMPRLWQKIEARRTFAYRFRRFSQVFVGAAAVLCLLIASVSTMMSNSQGLQLGGTYLDALADAHPVETPAALGVDREVGEAGR